MERRNLVAGLAVLALSLFVLSGTAFAHATHHKKAKPNAEGGSTGSPETCVVHAMPNAFMDQGEFGTLVERRRHHRSRVRRSLRRALRADQRQRALQPLRPPPVLAYALPGARTAVQPVGKFSSGPSFSVELDNDGNATAIVLGGPSCAAGESLIAAHLESAPYTTVTTGFTVLPPRPTAPGVFATPANKVEGEVASDVATIVQVEFPPVFAEEPVNVNASQLYSRCKRVPAHRMGRDGRPTVPKKPRTTAKKPRSGSTTTATPSSC